MIGRSRKAVIIGAGIAGPVAALLLKRAGIEAQLYEAWPRSTGIGGGLQIAPNGMHVLAEIGLKEEMISRGSVAESFDFHSRSGAWLGSINRNMEQRFGQPAVNIRRSTLNEMLLAKAEAEGVTLTFEKRLVRIDDRDDQPIIAYFADGSSTEADFLIGADGVHSAVRAHVIPDNPKPFDTGLIGFGGFVARSVIERAEIGQRVETTFGQSGSFGCGLCSPDPHQGGMWWSTQPAPIGFDAATFRAMSQGALKRHLQHFHAGWHDPIPQILEMAEDIRVTGTLDVATLPTWSRKRTLLIGDAAHATSQHAGQGASLGLEDAMRLGRLILEDREPGLTFRNFEDERRSRAERIVALARRNGNNKREYSTTGAWIRDQMLKLLIPITWRGMGWIYAYDPCSLTSPPETSSRRYRQAA